MLRPDAPAKIDYLKSATVTDSWRSAYKPPIGPALYILQKESRRCVFFSSSMKARIWLMMPVRPRIKRDLENHVRGLLKNLGLVIGRAKFNVFAVRAEELIEGRPELIAAIRPLLEARNAVGQQVSELDRKVMKLARHDAQVRRFMTVPGVGPITALAFKATIDDPARFARSRSVGSLYPG